MSPALLVGISFAVAIPFGVLLAAVAGRLLDPPAADYEAVQLRVSNVEYEVGRIWRVLAHSPDPVLQALSLARPIRHRLNYAYQPPRGKDAA